MYRQLQKVLEHMTRTNMSVPMFELLKEVPYTIASDRSCTQLEFDIAGTGLTYESSNCIGVYTENCPEVVEEAERWLGYSPDSFEVVDQGVQHFFVMIWDPGGIDVMYRLEGKPIFKKGGMLGTCHYAITYLITERAINR
jgi:sulfite reductase alpha subunit-like flavoprotein